MLQSFQEVLSKPQTYKHETKSDVSQSSELKGQTYFTLTLILGRGPQKCINECTCCRVTCTQTHKHPHIKRLCQQRHRVCVRTKRGFWKLGHVRILGQQFTTGVHRKMSHKFLVVQQCLFVLCKINRSN